VKSSGSSSEMAGGTNLRSTSMITVALAPHPLDGAHCSYFSIDKLKLQR
jgi:hypothetical protein